MKANIGLIGLAVMGENLALNMESKGFTVAVYNRSVPGDLTGRKLLPSLYAVSYTHLTLPTTPYV